MTVTEGMEDGISGLHPDEKPELCKSIAAHDHVSPSSINHADLEASRTCCLEVTFPCWHQRPKVTGLREDRVSCFPSYKRMRRQMAEATVLRHSGFHLPAHCPAYWLLS